MTEHEKHNRMAPELLKTLCREYPNPGDMENALVVVESFLWGILEYYAPDQNAYGKQVMLETIAEGVTDRLHSEDKT